MKKSLSALLAVLFVLAVILPFVVIGLAAEKLPAQYENTFLAGLKIKNDRISSVEGEKLVLIGGSNLAFGVDSALMEKYTGYPTVNYGLYAAIGTKAMLDMAKPHIGKGDIAVICPETDAQTYSLYYNGENMLEALDCDRSMVKNAGFMNGGKLIASLPGFIAQKAKFADENTTPDPEGVYNVRSFNEVGDVIYERPYNEMLINYDPTTPVNISKEIVADDFIDYLNDFAAYCRGKGAKVYFSFSPMNKKAIVSSNTDKHEFYRYLGENLDFEIISAIDDYILDDGYFFDSNFHMNDRGVLYRTALLAEDILRAEGKTPLVETVHYTASKRPDDYFSGNLNDDRSGFYNYEEGEAGLVLVSLTDLGREQTSLELPLSVSGTPIVAIGPRAFSDNGRVNEVIVNAESNIRTVDNDAFADSTVSVLRIAKKPADITVGAALFDNTAESFAVFVPKGLYADYATDYFWSGLMKHIRSY